MKQPLLLTALTSLGLPWVLYAADPGSTPLPASGSRPIPATNVPASGPSSDLALEQGKNLYEQGQYVAALDKFMKVLRRDPRHAEARQYLTLVMDSLRTQRKNAPKPQVSATGLPTAGVPTPMLDEEVRKRVRQRQLLTLDLAAIPGVKVIPEQKQVAVEIPTALLFAEKTGGLREEGIPILDRVAAWLKTFGQQPVVIHCYPEELDEASLSGSLFLHRYAQLYGFFVDEHKLPAVRFVSVEPGKNKKSGKDKEKEKSESPGSDAEGDGTAVITSSAAARIVIVSVGGGALSADESVTPSAKWLEFSILPSSAFFNPQEGDWVNLDLCALSRKGLRAWYFRIAPEKNKSASVLSLEGKGNLLKRVSWDGRDSSGSFVPVGTYVCRLSATDFDGAALSQEIKVRVQTGERAPVISKAKPAPTSTMPPILKEKPKAKPQPPRAAKPQSSSGAVMAALPKSTPDTSAPPVRSVPIPAPQVAYNTEPEDLPEVNAAKPAKPAPKPQEPLVAAVPVPLPPPPAIVDAEPIAEPAEEPAAEESDADNSVRAIWKQVIQFDVNDEDLRPTLKASLERIAKTLEVYPLQKVRILGFADRAENTPSTLAKQRAETVRSILVNEYGVEANRVLIAGGRVAAGGDGRSMSKVEISITN